MDTMERAFKMATKGFPVQPMMSYDVRVIEFYLVSRYAV